MCKLVRKGWIYIVYPLLRYSIGRNSYISFIFLCISILPFSSIPRNSLKIICWLSLLYVFFGFKWKKKFFFVRCIMLCKASFIKRVIKSNLRLIILQYILHIIFTQTNPSKIFMVLQFIVLKNLYKYVDTKIFQLKLNI